MYGIGKTVARINRTGRVLLGVILGIVVVGVIMMIYANRRTVMEDDIVQRSRFHPIRAVRERRSA